MLLIKLWLHCAQMARRGGVVYMFAQHLSLLSCLFTFLGVFDFGNGAALLRFTSWEAAGSIRWEKNPGPIPKSVAGEVGGTGAAGSRPRFHPRPVLRALPLPVHADGTALPDFIWGNLIPPLLPLERRSISGHMSTRFVRLFITINCCST